MSRNRVDILAISIMICICIIIVLPIDMLFDLFLVETILIGVAVVGVVYLIRFLSKRIKEHNNKAQRLAVEQEKECKQTQITDEERTKRREWAKKMAEARKRKREEERKKREYEEECARARRDENYKRGKLSQIIQSLSIKAIERETEEKLSPLKQLGANIRKVGQNIYEITTDEAVDVNKLFSLCEKTDLEYRIIINDLDNNILVYAIYDKCHCSVILEDACEEIVFKKGNFLRQAERFLFCYLENRKIKHLERCIETIILDGISQVPKLLVKGNSIEDVVSSALESSNYCIDFQKKVECLSEKDMLIVDYELPNMSCFSDVKEYKYTTSSKEISAKHYSESYTAKRYENVLYSITLRSLYEIFSIDSVNKINGITFNGFVTRINPATGTIERKCILSVQVDRQKFSQIKLSQVEPKACFKALKGVSAAKLIDVSPVTPVLSFNKKDKRFVVGKDISVNQGTNLAAMHWEDFEHLVRELFEIEFAKNGGEVRVTQASRDGGVDAIVFDPDPLRGGKIVIQAKRYTNTVGVSAVRDLYGTVINEGANSGILITTSDYGHDSYEFAKDKPLKLLNGGHLLALLHKNGRSAYINIDEAKKLLN